MRKFSERTPPTAEGMTPGSNNSLQFTSSHSARVHSIKPRIVQPMRIIEVSEFTEN